MSNDMRLNVQPYFCSAVVLVMSVEDEYRKHADRCRFLAESSPKQADRAFWLLLAQNWQLLAQDSEAEAEDEFKGAAE
jgi:hypothetical protein